MPEDGRDLFHKLAHVIAGTTHEDDLHLFVSMCAAYEYAVTAAKQVNEQGDHVTVDDRSVIRKNPAVQVFRDQLAMFDALPSKVGLSPSDRAKLIQSQPPQHTDPLEDVLSD
jgi:P27 family predicted phage terminase small subunit